ncbi:MAG: lactate utilization protein [bacterium]|nr:lactate utilization protein [bacterium]MDE0417271.1 lactate utilization protein [bacterium]
MSDARHAILSRIREASLPGRERDATARLRRHRRNLQPECARSSDAELIDVFVRKAEAVQASVVRVAGLEDVPPEVSRYLRHRNLPAHVAVAPHDDLESMDWAAMTITAERRKPLDSDHCGVNRAFCAVAESGTLIMTSGPDSPSTMNFLPETHIAVLKESDIVGAAEDVWDRLRASGRASAGSLPRTVNMITGVSRTGDIEQTIQTGVHGPRHLHIVLVKET